MNASLAHIATLCQATLHQVDAATATQTPIERLARDSRQVQMGDLFLALKGERFDAHDFAEQVAGKASAALVSRPLDIPIPQLVVDDVRLGLGRLAAAWRQSFVGTVVGLTGSNGKTTLKEMLTAILSQKGGTLATAGNFNNDIGMPLTLLRLHSDYDFAVIEMGANHFGEIEYLTQLCRPDVAILNNAGAAHLEGFGSIKGVSRAKGEIFSGLAADGIAVINADDAYADYWLILNQQRKVVTFGMQQPADVWGRYAAEQGFVIHCGTEQVPVSLKLLGHHNQMNALAAAAGAHALGLPLSMIKQGLETVQAVKGRLCPYPGQHGGLVIDDTYNANPTSAVAALEVLASLHGHKILVLGDMGELGETGVDDHAEIGRKAAHLGIDMLFSLGVLSAEASHCFGDKGYAFEQLDDLLAALQAALQPTSQVLIKGSRAARMERVVTVLTEVRV